MLVYLKIKYKMKSRCMTMKDHWEKGKV